MTKLQSPNKLQYPITNHQTSYNGLNLFGYLNLVIGYYLVYWKLVIDDFLLFYY
jgi:hypothetical protein